MTSLPLSDCATRGCEEHLRRIAELAEPIEFMAVFLKKQSDAAKHNNILHWSIARLGSERGLSTKLQRHVTSHASVVIPSEMPSMNCPYLGAPRSALWEKSPCPSVHCHPKIQRH